mmetsp:Transcript_11168/g.13629  ORF Transcript_11168/g.13629 Transcript_11168/m.13629 type:complete len:439 (+) Transcript_11168:82-1398(+)|eukprot:CAMPEP_0194359480 /NCGR_PEP_ID=MMETSP0174-20130528/6721_1 /TAXON_ID=216777 /ORGANISM="Proboscia alata, Strain PI-D3" /LENGTH=438 /DNA_ID=CAMNT_0039130385 /DNA_START=57 /DNA_END=1373 /DNA_ORIENTATION=+
MHSFCLITFVGSNILSSNAFSPIPAASSCTSKSKYIPRNVNIQTALHEQPTDTTIQDETVESPASLVFYDDVLDDSIPLGVVCARGVCVIDESIFETQDGQQPPQDQGLVDTVLNSYWGPRLLLAFASILYGTNFPLGSIMNDALNPSAATSARMVLASLALSPFLFQLSPALSKPALVCGCFTALGYISQSLALVDVSPATVAFLGAVTVIVCPTLEAFVDQKPMGVREAPQTWLAATLCLMGVGILELYDPSGQNGNNIAGIQSIGWGDGLAILQAVGFGTSFFLTERMMRTEPEMALPITAVQVSVTAFICMLWCFADGWVFDTQNDGSAQGFGLPFLFLEPGLGTAAAAVAWTGLITTALNRFIETTSLGKVASAEASVVLATEPLWAALFAALLLSDSFGLNDYIGGALIVLACLANTLKPADFEFVLGEEDK